MDSDGTVSGPFNVAVNQNNIHDYGKDGIYRFGSGLGVSPVPVNLEVAATPLRVSGRNPGRFNWGALLRCRGTDHEQHD